APGCRTRSGRCSGASARKGSNGVWHDSWFPYLARDSRKRYRKISEAVLHRHELLSTRQSRRFGTAARQNRPLRVYWPRNVPQFSSGQGKCEAMNVTLREVAARSQVSISTASRALNGRNDVSKEVRERVLSAAQELQYTANQNARALKGVTNKILGVVLYDGRGN